MNIAEIVELHWDKNPEVIEEVLTDIWAQVRSSGRGMTYELIIEKFFNGMHTKVGDPAGIGGMNALHVTCIKEIQKRNPQFVEQLSKGFMKTLTFKQKLKLIFS